MPHPDLSYMRSETRVAGLMYNHYRRSVRLRLGTMDTDEIRHSEPETAALLDRLWNGCSGMFNADLERHLAADA